MTFYNDWVAAASCNLLNIVRVAKYTLHIRMKLVYCWYMRNIYNFKIDMVSFFIDSGTAKIKWINYQTLNQQYQWRFRYCSEKHNSNRTWQYLNKWNRMETVKKLIKLSVFFILFCNGKLSFLNFEMHDYFYL